MSSPRGNLKFTTPVVLRPLITDGSKQARTSNTTKNTSATKTQWKHKFQNLTTNKQSFLLPNFDFPVGSQKFYCLSFEYTFQYDHDQVQFAYCVPYQYTFLLAHIDELIAKSQRASTPFLKVTKLTTSLGGLEVPLLTIRDYEPNEPSPERERPLQSASTSADVGLSEKCIVISGRAHPGQSNGSYMMHGFLEFLCGTSPMAQFLRKNVTMKIVPMLNPDGVVAGNYRTGLCGKDFNRQFMSPDRFVFPEIHAMKELVTQCKRRYKNNLLLFLDFHGHSIKKNVFMYGPQFPITERYYYESKILPKLLGRNTPMFRYYSCIFRVSSFKETTARAILLKKLNIPFSYTIEASNGSYYDKAEMKDFKFSPKLWVEMGQQIGQALHEYTSVLIATEQARLQKIRERQNNLNTKRNQYEARRTAKYSARSTATRRHSLDRIKKEVSPANILQQGFSQLMEQIKKQDVEQVKPQDKASDDGLSEGSSDGEQCEDDLSPAKVRRLYKYIGDKNFKGLESCRATTPPSRASHRPPSPNKMLSKQLLLKADKVIQADLSPQLLQDQQLPPIGQVFTNRGKASLKQKLLTAKQRPIAIQSVREALRSRQVAKVSNISFFNPFSPEQQQQPLQRGNLNTADMLRRSENASSSYTSSSQVNCIQYSATTYGNCIGANNNIRSSRNKWVADIPSQFQQLQQSQAQSNNPMDNCNGGVVDSIKKAYSLYKDRESVFGLQQPANSVLYRIHRSKGSCEDGKIRRQITGNGYYHSLLYLNR